MSVYWTRARHAELGETVLPADAVESYPGWEAVGEPCDDVDSLRAALAKEQAMAAAEAAAAPTPSPAPPPPAPKTGADKPEPEAPSGADQKE